MHNHFVGWIICTPYGSLVMGPTGVDAAYMYYTQIEAEQALARTIQHDSKYSKFVVKPASLCLLDKPDPNHLIEKGEYGEERTYKS